MPKCQKCHGVILGYNCPRKALSLGKVDLSHCAKVQEMQWVATRKNRMRAARKNWSARYLLSTSKGSLPMVGYNHHNCCNHYSCCDDCNVYSHYEAIVITMIADGEEKRSARICFGISFSLKSHLRNHNHAKVALCFSCCHKRSF